MKSFGRLFWALSAIAFALGSGCGNPELISNGGLNGTGGSGADGTGATAAVGATLSIGGDAETGSGCPSKCEELDADCGFVTDTKCGGVIQCGDHCPAGEIC